MASLPAIPHRFPAPGGAALAGLGLRPGDRVLIVGGYGVRNVGDEAILAGLLAQLPAGLRVRVVSQGPGETAAFHGTSAISPPRALAALFSCDVLLVGGGGIFGEHMGAMAKLIPLFCLLARARGLRVAFHGVGVYPSAPGWVLRALVWLAPLLSSFTVRDNISAALLRRRGVPVVQVPDLSTAMTPAPAAAGAALLSSLGLDRHQPVVGMCLTTTEPRLAQPLLEAVPELMAALPEVQFCFVPMSHHPTVPHHNDLLLGRRLQGRAPRLTLLETWHHPAEILALFGQLSAVVGMRYHSLLFSARCQKPLIPIAYAEKCRDWLQERGLSPVEPVAHRLIPQVRRALIGRALKS